MNKLPSVKQLGQLIGNPDAYAIQLDTGAYTPIRERLTPIVLRRHLEGNITVGTYILAGDKARTLVFDVDDGDVGKTYAIIAELRKAGIPGRGIGTEFSGKKGYHVWVAVANYMAASELRKLGRSVLDQLPFDCEVYPKQDRAIDLGNLVKLPGGIHRVSGKRAELRTEFPQPVSRSIIAEAIRKLPEPKKREVKYVSGYECLAACQAGPEEGWRNHGLYHLAVMLRKAGVSDDNVRDIIGKANERATPEPLPASEVDALLISSEHGGPLCRTLPENVRCESCPILKPTGGLFVKPDQLRHGAEGEIVTVTLSKRRDDGSVVLEHL